MSDFLRFRRLNDTLFQIPYEVRMQLRAFAQRGEHDLEAGGVLLGRTLKDGGHVVLDEITCPTIHDKRSRFGFEMNGPAHTLLMDAAWERSRGTCCYLGAWHTHAEPDPTPSGVDLLDWRRTLRENTWDGDTLLFVIVGTECIAAWEGDRRTGEIVKLTPGEWKASRRADDVPGRNVSDGLGHVVSTLDTWLSYPAQNYPRALLCEVRERLIGTQAWVPRERTGITASWNGIHLGRFDTEEEAHAVLNQLAVFSGMPPVDFNDKSKVVSIKIDAPSGGAR